MSHNCVDWTANPPTRKTPLLILAHGDDHVYTVVPKELKTLEEVARKEFNLGDVEIKFSSSCLNLCNELPARITESAWEHISPYIGDLLRGASIIHGGQAVSREEKPTVYEDMEDERDASANSKLPSNTDQGAESEQSDHGLDGKPDVSAKEAVRDEENVPSDHGNDQVGASAPEDQHEDPSEEEASAKSSPKVTKSASRGIRSRG
ncbi:hypothetical protein J3R83DRAFT_2495 [Lanmaoa asiatica]|nr:hypothetical protein J3R83DRAFT_2495 [Lanmaoa asiatica]